MVIFSGGTLLVILKGTPFHEQTLKRNIKQRTPQSTGVTPVLCCDYHRGKCRHDKDHFGTIRGNKKWLQCICAKCSLERHPEFSSHCPRLWIKTARRSITSHDPRIYMAFVKNLLLNLMSISRVVFLIVFLLVLNDTDRDLDFMDSVVLNHLDFVCYRVRDFSVRA